MGNSLWLTLYTYLMPILAGLSLLTFFCRLLTIWQKERTQRALVFSLVYFGLFILFLTFSLYSRTMQLVLALPYLVASTGAYLLLAFALLLGNWYEWRDLVGYLRRKDVAHHEAESAEPPPAKTLATAVDAGVAIVVEPTDAKETT